MKPPRISIVAVVSLLLFGATVVLAARGRSRVGILSFTTMGGHLQAVAAQPGGLLFMFTDVPAGAEKGLSADLWSVDRDSFATIHDMVFDSPNEKWHGGGFHVADGTSPAWGWRFRAFVVPYWALLITFAILPATWLRRQWRSCAGSDKADAVPVDMTFDTVPTAAPNAGV